MKPNPKYQDEHGHFKRGNPGGGRPKGFRRMLDDVYNVLAEIPIGDELQAMYEALGVPPGLQSMIDMAEDRQEALVRVIVYQALIGHGPALEHILARVAPAPKSIELSGPGGGPIPSAVANVDPESAEAEYMGLLRREPEGS